MRGKISWRRTKYLSKAVEHTTKVRNVELRALANTMSDWSDDVLRVKDMKSKGAAPESHVNKESGIKFIEYLS
jgi:transposase